MRSPRDHLRRLMDYTGWANDVLYQAISTVDEEVLRESKPGRPGGVIGVLGHIYVVGLIWRGHLMNEAHGFTSRTLEVLPELSEVRNWQSQLDHWYAEFAASLTTRDWRREIDFQFVDGGRGRMTVEEMLVHLCNHGTHHRGYIAAMLYDAGLKPPAMDVSVFVRDAMPD